MTSTLPPEVRDAFERFVTCELTTVDSAKQPITWPVTPYYDQGGPTIDVTTGLGYPKKADDARAHPSVSLLFSDPTGSGIDSGLRVLVQGTATVDDEDLKANAERYVRESGEKLPATKKMNPPKAVRPMFNWYYARLYIKVRPERIFVWPEGNLAEEPAIHDAHLEEVRSGHTEEPRADHGRPPQAPLGLGQPHGLPRRARHRRAQLDGAGRLPDRHPRPVHGRRAGEVDLDRRRPLRAAAPRGPRLPHRPRALPGLHLAAQHAGAGHARTARAMDGGWFPGGSSAASSSLPAASAASATSSRRARASTGPIAGGCASARPRRPSAVQEPIFGGNGSRPAFQGPGL